MFVFFCKVCFTRFSRVSDRDARINGRRSSRKRERHLIGTKMLTYEHRMAVGFPIIQVYENYCERSRARSDALCTQMASFRCEHASSATPLVVASTRASREVYRCVDRTVPVIKGVH